MQPKFYVNIFLNSSEKKTNPENISHPSLPMYKYIVDFCFYLESAWLLLS